MLLVGQFSTQTEQPLHFCVSTSIAPLNAIVFYVKIMWFFQKRSKIIKTIGFWPNFLKIVSNFGEF